MRLTDGVVSLRAIERRDLEAWRTWVNDPEIGAMLDRVLPVSDAEHEVFFEKAVIGNAGAIWFAIETHDEKRHIGNVWLWNINQRHRNAEVRIVIGIPTSGAGTRALDLIAAYSFEHTGLHKLYAYVMERNPRALRSFQKARFAEEAVLREEVVWKNGFENVYRLARFSQGVPGVT